MKLRSLKWYRQLHSVKGRRETGFFLVEGARTIEQVMLTRKDVIVEILTTENTSHWNFPVRVLSPSQLNGISTRKNPQPVIALVTIPEETYSDHAPESVEGRLLYLEHIQDPGNAGTLIRSAAAFGFTGVILTEDSADPYGPKCVQASAGTLFSLWIRRGTEALNIMKSLKSAGFYVAAADLNGENDALHPGTANLILALGNEASGLSNEVVALSDTRIQIPIAREKAESLNVAASGAILMYLAREASLSIH
jgi:TrmH family RNA methyltransferase